MPRFELVHYGEDAATDVATHIYEEGSEIAVRQRAGRLAKRIKGPVDIAYADFRKWGERYITTASPSKFHATGFRFERLD